MTKYSNLKYPAMRVNLVAFIDSLSDLDYQKKCWVENNCPPPIQGDNFAASIHFLYDDTRLSTHPELLIGVILYDEAEVEEIRKVTFGIDRLFEIYGTELSDIEYISTPEWRFVLEAAACAKIILSENEDN